MRRKPGKRRWLAVLLLGSSYANGCVTGDIAPRPDDSASGGPSSDDGSGGTSTTGGSKQLAGAVGATESEGGAGGESGSNTGTTSDGASAGRSGTSFSGAGGKVASSGGKGNATGGAGTTGSGGTMSSGGRAGSGGAIGSGGASEAGTAGASGAGAGSTPSTPVLLRPWNGEATGSLHAPLGKRPLFRWEASAGTERYELQIDDSCTPNSFASCVFPSPEIDVDDLTELDFRPTTALAVSSTAPVGRRYYWRLRACDAEACSAWSATRYVDVGRQRKDLDGDGYADIVVATASQSLARAEAGAFHVAYGPDFARTASSHGTEIYQGLGNSVAFVGDVDADGYGDLAVGDDLCIPTGADRYPCTPASRTFLYRGGPKLLDGDFSVMLAIGGSELGALGDFNGDGFADFVAETGTIVFGQADVSKLSAQAPLGSDFQDAALGADLNSDGFADLLLRKHGYCGKRARLELYRGGAGGVVRTPTAQYELQDDCGGDAEGLVAGDIDGDGRADVATGTASAVHLLLGQRTPGFMLEATYPATYFRDPGLAAGDINGDGIDDILISEPGGLFLGAAFPRATPDVTLTPPGEFVTFLGDVNGDGFGDFGYLEPDVGQVSVCLGSRTPDDGVDDLLPGFGPSAWEMD